MQKKRLESSQNFFLASIHINLTFKRMSFLTSTNIEQELRR
jgi:hypothetical protein